jgi:hypothetical protein
MWGQSGETRREFERELSGTQQLWEILYLTPNGMRYVSFGDDRPRRSQINWLRCELYVLLPREITEGLPPEIQRKYGSCENSAMMAAQKEKKENLFLV